MVAALTELHPDLKTQPPAPRSLEIRSLEQQIGNTPLLGFRRITAHLPEDIRIFAKAEWTNPGGSVKDRAALNIIREAERSGALTKDKILLDSTSGNTGIAYAMIGAARGYRIKLCLPANASPERIQILRAYGAELVLTDPLDGSDGAILKARELLAENPDLYYYADQYSNEANWRAHYSTTAPEIWEQTGGAITHFVAGLGTSGTLVGVARRLRECSPGVQVISLQPDSPLHGVEGWKHMPSAIRPAIYDDALANRNLGISTEAAHEMARRLAREEGYLVGISAAAAMVGALQVADKLAETDQPALIVTLFPDNAYKYLSEAFWTK